MSYCCCSTAEQVNQEFVRIMKDRMRELNLMRLTARGVDIPNERFVYEVTQRGHLLILR